MRMPGWLAAFMLRRGMLAEIAVVGRRSGVERRAIVNKRAAPDGGYYVVAGGPDHQWALNLRAAGRCTLTLKGKRGRYIARELDGAEREAAARALTPPFADPAKAIRGPVFRLDREA